MREEEEGDERREKGVHRFGRFHLFLISFPEEEEKKNESQ